jgi:hypothetical protein
MSGTEDLEKQERERRGARTAKLQHWATELKALGDDMFAEDLENGWRIQMVAEPQLTVFVTMIDDGFELVRFARD